MPAQQEKSCGAIIFHHKPDKSRTYLLLRYKNYWGFVKGNIEAGESKEQTAKREAKEEANLDIHIMPNFKEDISYFYRFEGKPISKSVMFLLAEAKTQSVRLSEEHSDFKWIGYEEAVQLVKFKNSKELLSKAEEFLKRAGK